MSFFDNIINFIEGPQKPARTVRPQPVQKKGNWLLNSDNRPAEIPDIMNSYDRVTMGGLNQYVQPGDLKALALYSDIVYLTFNKLKAEMFRNGFDIKPKYDQAIEEQEVRVNDFLKKCNENGQSLKEVLEELEDDLNTYDDCYGLLLKKYAINGNKEIIKGNVDEFIRLNPLSISMMFDELQRLGRDKDGKPIYFNIKDRSEITHEPYCKETGMQNLRACYKVRGVQRDIYYDSTEIIHCSKYKPSKLYGFSPLYSLYNKSTILINQDKYIKDYYSGNKAPKSLIVANTSNVDSFKTALGEWKEKTKRDPHGVHPILHQKGNGDSAPVFDFINLMNNLNEMQYTQTREEIRRNIGALYGVSPVFMNDVSTSGGLNNEGLQITVTDRAVELGQEIYNSKVLPFIFDQMGITDFEITLIPSRDEDQVFEKDLRLKELQIAKATAELGIKTRMNEDGEFVYEAGEVDISAAQPEFIPFQNNEEGVTVETPVQLSKQMCKKDDGPCWEGYEMIGFKEQDGKKVPNCVPIEKLKYEDWGEETTKAEYQGKDVELNKPFRTPGASKKYGVYVKDGDKVKLVRFGSSEMENNRDDPEARRSFRARMQCDTAKDKTTPRYWSCKFWSSTPVSELLKKDSPEQDLETTLDKELKKILSKLDRKRKPTEEQFNKIVDDIANKLNTNLKKKSSTRLKAIYEKAMKETGKELDMSLKITEKDKNILDALKRDVVYQKAFKELSDNVSEKLKTIITEAYDKPEEFSINNIVSTMKEEMESTDNKLRTIARTETSKISIAARKASYEKSGFTYKYKWIGPDDKRTSGVSKEIKKRTNKGVSWDELVTIIQEESRKKSPKWEVNPLAPIPHPNTRHTFIAERVD